MPARHFRFLPAAIPLLLRLLLLRRPQDESTGEAARALRSPEPAVGIAVSAMAAMPPRAAAAATRGPSLWRINPAFEGTADGLRPAFAATNRGRNELPWGWRWKVEGFPDLRALKEGERVTVSVPDGRALDGLVAWSLGEVMWGRRRGRAPAFGEMCCPVG